MTRNTPQIRPNHETEEDAVIALQRLPDWARHPLVVAVAISIGAGALFAAGMRLGALAANDSSSLLIAVAIAIISVALVALGVVLDRRTCHHPTRTDEQPSPGDG